MSTHNICFFHVEISKNIYQRPPFISGHAVFPPFSCPVVNFLHECLTLKISFCSLMSLYNSKFILMAASFGTTVFIVTRVNCSITLG